MRIKKIVPKPKSIQAGVTHEEMTPLLEPTNKWSLDRSAKYSKELHKSMEAVVNDTREFFLKDIFPTALSLTNGFADANEVLTNSLGENATAAPLMSLVEGYMIQAVRSRILLFVANKFGMTPSEQQIYLVSALSKDGVSQGSIDDRVETLLREMQSLSDLSRARQKSEVQLQQLPQEQGAKRRKRVRPDGIDAEPGPRRGSKASEEISERASGRLRAIRRSISR